MANTFDSDLYGTIVGTSAIRIFQSVLKPLTAFSTNFTGEIGTQNESIVVPLTTDPETPEDFDPVDGYISQDTTVGETTVTLNKHKFVSWNIQDKDTATSRFLNLENVGLEKGQKLAIAVFQDILSLVTAANYGDTTADKAVIAATAMDKDVLEDIALLCDNADWWDMGRQLLLKPAYWRNLMKDEATLANTYGSRELVLGANNGPITMSDFAVHKCNAIPANAQNLTGFAALPNAMAIVNRYLPPAGGGKPGSIYNQFTDDETGLTIGYREYYDDDLGVRRAILEAWYGFAIGNNKGIKRIVSA